MSRWGLFSSLVPCQNNETLDLSSHELLAQGSMADELNIEEIEVNNYEEAVPFERLPHDGVLSVSIEKILSELPSTRHNSSNPSTLGRVSFAVGSLPIDARMCCQNQS